MTGRSPKRRRGRRSWPGCTRPTETLMRANDRFDFGDQVSLSLRLLRDHPRPWPKSGSATATSWSTSSRTRTTRSSSWSSCSPAHHGNVTVVGDDDQSIYRFRGAALRTSWAFRGLPTLRKRGSVGDFRRRQPFLDAAHRLIRHNDPDRLEAREGLDKRMPPGLASTSRPAAGPRSSCCFATGWDEADALADRIGGSLRGGRSAGDHAILVRATAMRIPPARAEDGARSVAFLRYGRPLSPAGGAGADQLGSWRRHPAPRAGDRGRPSRRNATACAPCSGGARILAVGPHQDGVVPARRPARRSRRCARRRHRPRRIRCRRRAARSRAAAPAASKRSRPVRRLSSPSRASSRSGSLCRMSRRRRPGSTDGCGSCRSAPRLGRREGSRKPRMFGEGGAAEAIDALVVVAHHRQVGGWRSGQQLDQLELRMVRVLELVDQDVPVALRAPRLEDGGVLAQQAEGEADLVAEVDRSVRRISSSYAAYTPPARPAGPPSRPSAASSGVVARGWRPVARRRRVFRRGDVLVACAADEGDQGVQEAGRVAERAVSVQGKLEQVLAQEDRPARPATGRSNGRRGRPPWRGREGSRSPQAWKVLITVSVKPYGTSRSTRSVISRAARSVKVRARISDGLARFSAISQAIRRVMTVVLPVPAPGHDQERPLAVRHRLALARRQVGEQRRLDAEVRTAGARGGAASSSKNGSWFG